MYIKFYFGSFKFKKEIKIKSFESEKDLAKHVISWLQEQYWEVWQEVQFRSFGPTNDIYAVKDKLTWAIECKLTLNLKVIEQAYHSKAIFKSIAVPNKVYSSFGEKICEDYGIGIIYVNQYGNINSKTGKLNRSFYKKFQNIKEHLDKIPKTYCEAGSKHGHWTPYKNTMDQCKNFIKNHPGCLISEIMSDIDHHYSSDKSAKSCIVKALQTFESSWCKIEDKKFYLK